MHSCVLPIQGNLTTKLFRNIFYVNLRITIKSKHYARINAYFINNIHYIMSKKKNHFLFNFHTHSVRTHSNTKQLSNKYEI